MDKRIVVAGAVAGIAVAGYLAYRLAFKPQVAQSSSGVGHRPPPPPPPTGPRSLTGAPGAQSVDDGGYTISDYADDTVRAGLQDTAEAYGIPAPLADVTANKVADAGEWVGSKIASIF